MCRLFKEASGVKLSRFIRNYECNNFVRQRGGIFIYSLNIKVAFCLLKCFDIFGDD